MEKSNTARSKKKKKTKNQQQKGNIWQIKIQNLLSDHVTVGCGIVGFFEIGYLRRKQTAMMKGTLC